MAQIALLAVGLGMSGYQSYQARSQEKEDIKQINKQREDTKTAIADRKKMILAQQKASFSASGISLTDLSESSLPSVFFEETRTATAKDMQAVGDYYDTQISNTNSRTRAQYIKSIGQAASSVYSYTSSLPTTTAGDWTSPAGQTFNYR